MYADKEKQGVFDRLQSTDSDKKSSRDSKTVMVGAGKNESSIFSRLGGKKEIDDITMEENSAFFSGILKNSSKMVNYTIPRVSNGVNMLFNIPDRQITEKAGGEKSKGRAGQTNSCQSGHNDRRRVWT